MSALSVPFTVTTFSPMALLGEPGRILATLLPSVVGTVAIVRCPTGRADRALLAVGVLYLAAVRLSARAEVAVVGGAVVMGAISPMSTLPFGIVTWTGAGVVAVIVIGFHQGVGPWVQRTRTVLP